ncbi:hypothetical protein TIFTF001_010276 [Ficus carica]|uniref:F-box domain-containing protein n=1 Tax=Ficus carica TaxID=3494 RepID=A0AA88CZP3_FICCA|nr:hypothetical protein TIFTF001_010276 [Ficus carica]
MNPTKRIFTASSNTMKSAETIANNVDLLTQILLFLPIKSLLKFKSVSKHWLSLISDPDLRRRVSSTKKPISGLFLFRTFSPSYDFLFIHNDDDNNNPSPVPSRPLTFVEHLSGIEILQSCNGLFLCSGYKTDPYLLPFSQPFPRFYVYNPTTNEFIKLPRLQGDTRTWVLGINMSFDPAISPHYKVVCFQSCGSPLDTYCRIKIYSSETRGAWRQSGDPFSVLEVDHLMFDFGVFCNGAIHWLSHSETTSLRFNVDKEKLREMPMPLVHNDPNWDASTVRYFGESNGHLHIVNLHHSRRTEFDVSEIEREYSGWFVKYRVDINGVLRAFPEMIRRYLDPLDMDYYGFSILCVVREEADEESSLVLHIPGKALRFNVKKLLKALRFRY